MPHRGTETEFELTTIERLERLGYRYCHGEDLARQREDVVLKDVLRRELDRPSWVREQVAVGTATDPYQPIEGHYKLTRGSLEALLAGGFRPTGEGLARAIVVSRPSGRSSLRSRLAPRHRL